MRSTLLWACLAFAAAAQQTAPPRNKEPAPAARAVLEAALRIVKTNALRRDAVAWSTVEPEYRALAAGAERSSDVYPAIQYLLRELGDRHSSLRTPDQTAAFRTGGAENPPADVRALADAVGYIKVPAYFGAEAGAMRAYAVRAHEAIMATLPAARCGWIVDLRTNGGGNMWPMLAGLKPLLGDGPLGSFEGGTGPSVPWIAGRSMNLEPLTALAPLEAAWVAVLTGPRTASSGEAVAIAFRGRPRTRSFGAPTAGLSTANGTFPLPDGAMLLLTVSVQADRTGRRYGEKVEPDEPIDGGASADPEAAPTAATRWLRAASGCTKGS
jgi:C-terminal processing protease CtpA/Prc